LTPEQAATARLKAYFAAASKLDPKATRSFLSPECDGDIVTEFKGMASSGWKYSEADSEFNVHCVTADSASIEVKVAYKGGNPPTYWKRLRTFGLSLEKGAWRITSIDPKPGSGSPGFAPLN
jgi:hypothetical protein